MKTSFKGYKDNSPDRKERSLFINSNTLTMEGVSQPITAIPIIDGSPDYTQRVILRPGDADYTNPKASGFIEIPIAQNGFQTPTNIFGNPNLNLTNSFNPYSNQTLAQKVDDNNSSFYNTNYKQNALPEALRSFENYQNSMVGSGVDNKGYDNIVKNFSNQDDNHENLMNNTNSFEEFQKKLMLLNNAPSAGLSDSLNTLGWSLGFDTSKLDGISQNAKKTLNTSNNILKVASAGNSLLKGAYEVTSGLARGKRDSEDRQALFERWSNNAKNLNTFNLQKGGEILTGGYTTGLADGNPMQPNAEVERGEFLKNPNTGQVEEVLGKRHSEGGEMMNLEGGTKVVSDYLEIGSELSRTLKKEFNLSVTPKTTFAKTLSKFRDKIGLTKQYEEQEKIINKIKDQEDVDNDNTRDLNYSILSKKYSSKNEEIQPLENQLQNFTDFIFEEQEKSKTIQNDKERYNKLKKGGVVKHLQEGGEMQEEQILQIVDAFCDMTGNDPNEVMSELQQLSPEEQQQALQAMVEAVQQGTPEEQPSPEEQPIMQEGGEQQNDVERIIIDFAQATGANPEEIMQELQQLSPEEQQQAIQEMAQYLEGSVQEEPVMQNGGETPNIQQVIMAYAQLTGVDPQSLAQSLQELSEEELQQEMDRMISELQNIQ